MDWSQYMPRAWGLGGWVDWLTFQSTLGHGLIASAYMVIPLLLLYAVRILRRNYVIKGWRQGVTWHLLIGSAAFIGSCGIGHSLEIMGIWIPAYPWIGAWHILTGIISWVFVFLLFTKMGLLKDLTTRRAAALTLPFDIVIERVPIGIAVVSSGNYLGDRMFGWQGEVKEGRWLLTNKYVQDLLQRDGDELRHMTFQDVTTSKTLQEDLNKLGALKARVIEFYDLDKAYNRKDGIEVPVHLSVSARWADDMQLGDEPLYYVASIESQVDLFRRAKEIGRVVHDLNNVIQSVEVAADDPQVGKLFDIRASIQAVRESLEGKS